MGTLICQINQWPFSEMLVNHCCVKPFLTLYLLFESATFIINLQSRNCLNFYFLFVLFCFGLFFRLFFFGAGCCGLVCWWLSCVNPSCVQALGATLFSNVCLTLDDQTPVIPKRKITNPCDGVCVSASAWSCLPWLLSLPCSL